MTGEVQRPLEMHVASQGDQAVIVALKGSAGMSDAEQLRCELDRAADQADQLLVLDLGELEFICSQGLGVLVALQSKMKSRSGQLRLARPQPPVLRVLEMTRLTKLFGVHGSVDEAMGAPPS
jgi:anti-sigma B factor antagonist